MNKICVLWIALIFPTMSQAVVKPDMPADPYVLVQHVASNTFKRIKNQHAEIELDKSILKDIVEQELFPYVDYKFAALKVLGKNFKNIPKEKALEFMQVFRSYLIGSYAAALEYYNDQTFQVEPSKPIDVRHNVRVRVLVQQASQPDIDLAFIMRLNKQTNEWMAYDIVAEGISMLASKQSEFDSLLRKGDIQTVIDLIKQKS
ncbi:MlaC/ttg2D family ABC transporter substrate-binding protein [Shewanella vesiculosa]|uniref:MlaC/ttg2D family ABC transporter substrate-binding protein n=1 Tax=Shewanella vesiculosa TaxID=518738 RepID=UPI00384AE6F7